MTFKEWIDYKLRGAIRHKENSMKINDMVTLSYFTGKQTALEIVKFEIEERERIGSCSFIIDPLKP